MSDHHDKLLALLSYDQCFLAKDDANEVAAWIRSLSAEGRAAKEVARKLWFECEGDDQHFDRWYALELGRASGKQE